MRSDRETNAGENARGRPLGWRGVLRALGFFPALFGVVFGTPALISLLQAALITGDLSAPLQDVINAYNNGLAIFGALVEPPLLPIITRLGEVLHWNLILYPHWRQLFVISMLLFSSEFRVIWIEMRGELVGSFMISISFVKIAICGIFCIASGLIPLDEGWFHQVAIAVIPMFGIIIPWMLEKLVLMTVLEKFKEFKEVPMLFGRFFISILIYTVLALCVVSLIWLGSFRSRSGIIFVASFVLYVGLAFVGWFNPAALINDKMRVDTGYGILGGFTGAGLVYAFDWALKSFG